MAKKKTIIKKPVGNGNISITIENNLKNTNPPPHNIPVKRRRRRTTSDSATTDITNSKIEDMLRSGGGGSATGGGFLPPLKDVSYIKPGPSNNFTVWRDNFNDSYNTTIPQGQAQQMGMLPLPKVEAPPPQPPPQLALTAPPAADTPLTMREFAMIMMQQGKARPGYQNLHEDPYNEDEPMDDRYTNLRPSSRIEAVEEDVLKEAGATEEQIQNYQQQIQQHKAINTTNEQKLATAGIDPEIIKNVKKIAAMKTAGTWQGKRNIKPNGDYIDDPNFIASYNAARADRLSKQPSEREIAINKNKKYTLLGENEDPWAGVGSAQAPEEEEDVNLLELATMRDQLKNMAAVNYDDINSEFVTVRKGRGRNRTDEIQTEEETPRKALRESILDQSIGTAEEKKLRLSQARQKLIAEAKPKEKISDAIKGYKARKEARRLQEVDAEIKAIKAKESATSLLVGALKGYKARKEVRQLQEAQIRREEEAQKEQAGKVITKAMTRYQATKQKKAWEKRTKETLEAEILALKQEIQGISPQKEPKTSVKSKAIQKAMESVTDFWLADTVKEAAKQGKKDAKQAKKDAQKEAEDKLSAKSKALQERRKQLEALGK